MQNVPLQIYDSTVSNLQVEKVIKSWYNVLKSERQIEIYIKGNANENNGAVKKRITKIGGSS